MYTAAKGGRKKGKKVECGRTKMLRGRSRQITETGTISRMRQRAAGSGTRRNATEGSKWQKMAQSRER
jgi:predicted secreted protein